MTIRRTMAALAAAVITLTGCSIANTTPDQVALHYSAGPLDSKEFVECIPSATKLTNDINDDHFYYPQGQRTFTFDTTPGADGPPINVSTKGNRAELVVRGTITFHLNTDCTEYKDGQGKAWKGGILQRFHDMIGRQKDAYGDDGGEAQHDGWKGVLQTYLGSPAEKAMDNAGLNYPWEDLYGTAEAKGAWEKSVLEELPKLILAQAGDQHFIIDNIQIQKPDVPPGLRAELDNNQAAILKKNTADTDKSIAENFPGGLTGYMEYQRGLAITARELATAQAIKDGKVQVVPQGSSIIVQGNK